MRRTRDDFGQHAESWRSYAWSPSGEPPLRELSVHPADGGWCVEAEGLAALVFTRGAQAEQQAKALGRAFAASGFDALIRVHDAREVLVGTVRYFGSGELITADARDRYPWSRMTAAGASMRPTTRSQQRGAPGK